MRQDKCFVGGEDIEVKTEKKLLVEVWLFVSIGIICIFLFLTQAALLERYFGGGGLKALRAAFIFLILSPFGAELLAKVIIFLYEKFK